MKWVVASDHDQPNRPLSQEIATNGARGMNWLQDWVHDFDALSALYWLSAAFSDSHYGPSRDDCSTRASNCREVWAPSKCAGYRLSALNLATGWSLHCEQRSSGHILLTKGVSLNQWWFSTSWSPKRIEVLTIFAPFYRRPLVQTKTLCVMWHHNGSDRSTH